MKSSRWNVSGAAAWLLGAAAAMIPAESLSAADQPDNQAKPPSNEIKLRPVEESTSTEESIGAEDVMEDRQSFNTYTSLEDGQPGQPGEFQINYFNGWETRSHESDPWLMEIQIEYTLGRTPDSFLRNTKIGLTVPLELGNGAVDGNGDIELSWIQRWLAEEEGNWWPTISTVNEVRIPSGYHSEKVDWTMTGVIAKELGPGTAVFNAFVKSANGNNNLESDSSWQSLIFRLGEEEEEDLRNFQWGFKVGYKWRITDSFALIADYVMQSSELRGNHNQNIGEVSAEWRVTDQLTIGPGIMFGLDGADETPNFGAGVLIHYEWE